MKRAAIVFGFLGAVFFFFNFAEAGSGNGRVQYLPVSSDKNIVVEGGPYIEYYWVETDGTKGEIILEFDNNIKGGAKSVGLWLNVPDVKDAESQHGCNILYRGNVIGGLSNGMRNSWYEILLSNFMPPQGRFTLEIKAKGTDGLAIYSKASSFGPVLKIQY